MQAGLNELLAALFQEFNETTPANVEQGKQAISLIFNDVNRNMRLVGTFAPLARAFDGGRAYSAVERENDTWFYRRSIPLSNTFHPNCVLCHTNFTPAFFSSTNNPGQWVGTLVLSVPVQRADDD